MDGRIRIVAVTLTLLLALASVAGARMNPVMLGGSVAAAVSGVGGWTHIATVNANEPTSSGTEATATASLDINDGDVIVAAMRWESTSATCSFGATSGAANTFPGDVVQDSNGGAYICVGYQLNATNNDSATIRGTLSAAQDYRRMIVMQFRPAVVGVAQLGGTPVTGKGSGTAVSSGNYTSSGEHPLIIGIGGSYIGLWSNPQLGGGTPTAGGAVGGESLMGYAYLIGASTDDPFSATSSFSGAWVSTVFELK